MTEIGGAAMGHSLDDLGPLYHSYRLFGAANAQIPGMYERNQRSKEVILGAYIQFAIAKCRNRIEDDVTFAELFCADGYYAMLARHFGATHSIGIDNDRDKHFAAAQSIADRLGVTNVEFIQSDVNLIDQFEQVDIVANVGGLYHVPNPEEILLKSYQLARHFLIVQTVVNLATDDPNYFEVPAPGWDWGCRHSRASFTRLIEKQGWNVVDSHFNELEGNGRPEDLGSLYYLIATHQQPAQLSRAQRKLQAVYESTSWKLTSLLRWFATRLSSVT